MTDWDLHNDMNLYLTPERFIIEPNGKNELLIIDRLTNETKVGGAKNYELEKLMPNRRVCGILGTICLIAGQYLVVATHRLFVGVINESSIWRLAGYDIIPYIPTTTHLTQVQRTQNETYISMLKKVLDTQFLYFSYTYDLTHTLQRLHSSPPEFVKAGLFERADHRFVWNKCLLESFQCHEMRHFALPLIMGFISTHIATINGYSFNWVLVSRRSVQRAGVRLFCRGIDEKGYCANFVETEQIVEFECQKLSFVQTRGSMPFFWQQVPNLYYKPRPEILIGKDHLQACSKHMDTQMCFYGQQVLINLVDQKGAEGNLEKTYSDLVSQLSNPSVRYEAFDFHSECKNLRWDRLNILIDRLAHEQDEFSMYHLGPDGSMVSAQIGTFRVNCIDCLDRTNVVQSMLARRSLTNGLVKLGILSNGQTIQSVSPEFEFFFKGTWADNADMISFQYSGTGALKTDFTRTGKRTQVGLLNDGVNSLTRYYLNNFCDGFRQDSIDLFLCNYKVQEGEGSLLPSSLVYTRGWKYGTFPLVLLCAVSMFFASIIFPKEYHPENLLYIMFWAAMVGVTTVGIFKYGSEFVDVPRLLPLIKVEA